MWPWIGLAVLLAGTVAAVLWWWSPAAPEVRTAVVREATGGEAGPAAVLNASGYVTARRRATVASEITGRLEQVSVEEGMPVEAGQVLARIDDEHYRAAVALAEALLEAARVAAEETRAELALAETTLARTRRLTGEGITGQAELDEAASRVEVLQARLASHREQDRVAEHEVALRRSELADTVIRAPFAGVVISEDAEVGEMVSPLSAGGGFTRTGIATIVDMDSLEIEVDVNEAYISRVEPRQPVVAVLDAYPDWRIPGRVITTVPAADRQKATVLVRIGLDRLDTRILPDMGVQVTFLEERDGGGDGAGGGNDAARPVLLVPPGAVGREDGREVVWVVDDEDRVERRAVSTGARTADAIEIRSGLSPGERIVVDPPPGLGTGDRVRAQGA